jgi:hypothetical protein
MLANGVAKIFVCQLVVLHKLLDVLRVSSINGDAIKGMDVLVDLHPEEHCPIVVVFARHRLGDENCHTVAIDANLSPHPGLLEFVRIHFGTRLFLARKSRIVPIQVQGNVLEERWIGKFGRQDPEMESGEHGTQKMRYLFGMRFAMGFVEIRVDGMEATFGDMRRHTIHCRTNCQMVQYQQSFLHFAVWAGVDCLGPNHHKEEKYRQCAQRSSPRFCGCLVRRLSATLPP